MPIPSPEKTADLIRIVQSPDATKIEINDATSELVSGFAAYVSAPHARRGAVDRDELEALAAESIWRAAKLFDLDRGAAQFGSFAFLLTQRAVIDFLRRESRQTGRATGRETFTLQDIDAPVPESDPAEKLIEDELFDRVNISLSGLEMSVLNHRRHGLTFAEIARTLGRGLKSVKNAADRVRLKLADLRPDTQGPVIAIAE